MNPLRTERDADAGHVYVLTSPRCEFVKIGGTDYAPCRRIPQINSTEPYKSLGPWCLHDFRYVTDWRKVEHSLHYRYRSHLVRSVPGQRELFDRPAVMVSNYLATLDASTILYKPKVDRLFQDHALAEYLAELFRVTGILHWLDLQGAWTMTLFPATGAGRYFTLNIGRHEVAYSTTPRQSEPPIHMVYMDRMVREIDPVRHWVHEHGGTFEDQSYASALDRSTSVTFSATLTDALEFLRLPGVRRAIIAYWAEALIRLRERGSRSLYARYHQGNAVAELNRRIALGEI